MASLDHLGSVFNHCMSTKIETLSKFLLQLSTRQLASGIKKKSAAKIVICNRIEVAICSRIEVAICSKLKITIWDRFRVEICNNQLQLLTWREVPCSR